MFKYRTGTENEKAPNLMVEIWLPYNHNFSKALNDVIWCGTRVTGSASAPSRSVCEVRWRRLSYGVGRLCERRRWLVDARGILSLAARGWEAPGILVQSPNEGSRVPAKRALNSAVVRGGTRPRPAVPRLSCICYSTQVTWLILPVAYACLKD